MPEIWLLISHGLHNPVDIQVCRDHTHILRITLSPALSRTARVRIVGAVHV